MPYISDNFAHMAELRISDLGSLNFSHDWKQPFQIQESYVLKYLTTDTIRVQYALSSDAISPAVRLLNVQTGEITILTAVEVSATDEYSTYNVTISDLPTGCYVFQFYLNEVLAWASFSIHEELENSRLFEYTNEKNDHETVFTEPFFFRVEGVFLPQELTPQVESNNFRDQRYIQHLLSASPYNVHTLTVGGKFGAPNYVEDKLNRIFSCTSVLIDGEEYTRAEGTSTEKEVFSPAYPLHRYKIQVEKSTNGEKIIPLSYSILISGRVEDIISKESISGANVSISLGGYEITAVTTSQSGDFTYQWRISESDYNSLIAEQGLVLRFAVSKGGYMFKESQTNTPAYNTAVRDGISVDIQLFKEPVNLTEVPAGYDFKGRALEITEFEKLLPANLFYGTYYLRSSLPPDAVGGFEIMFDIVGTGIETYPRIHIRGRSISGVFEREITYDGSWSQTSFVFPADTNFIVEENTLFGTTHEGDYWWPDYMIISGFPTILTADIVPVGYNMRGKTIVFTETDRPMTDQDMFNREDWIGGAVDGLWTLMSTFDGGIGSENEINCNLPGNRYTQIWFVNTGWQQTSFTFPDDQDYIVNTNTLRPAAGDSWGWQYAIITD